MAVRNFNDAEKQKLIQIISQGSQVLGEVEDLKGGLKDTVTLESILNTAGKL
jgi:hypothetical protein